MPAKDQQLRNRIKRNKKRRYRAEGKCGCGRWPIPDRKSCQHCLDRYKVIAKRMRQVKKDRGVCRCTRPPEPGKTSCPLCSQKQRDKALALKLLVLRHYGGACGCCGQDDVRFLTIDHTDGGGCAHRRSLTKNGKHPPGGKRFYQWLKLQGFPEGFQVLCFNCNCGRNANGGVCPHLEDEV